MAPSQFGSLRLTAQAPGALVVVALAIVQPVAILCLKLIAPESAVGAPFLLFVSAVAFAAAIGGVPVGLMAALSSAVLAAVFLLEPFGRAAPLGTVDSGHLVGFLLEAMFVVCVIGALRHGWRSEQRAHELAVARLNDWPQRPERISRTERSR